MPEKNHEQKRKRLIPKNAIRKFCLYCVNNQPKEVEICPSKICPLKPYRLWKSTGTPRQRLDAIHAYCRQCGEGTRDDIKHCKYSSTTPTRIDDDGDVLPDDNHCFLYPFRMGRNPYAKRRLSEEHKKALIEGGRPHRFAGNTVQDCTISRSDQRSQCDPCDDIGQTEKTAEKSPK